MSEYPWDVMVSEFQLDELRKERDKLKWKIQMETGCNAIDAHIQALTKMLTCAAEGVKLV